MNDDEKQSPLMRERLHGWLRKAFGTKPDDPETPAPAMTRDEFRRATFQALGRYLEGAGDNADIAIDLAAFYGLLAARLFQSLPTSSVKKFSRMMLRSWQAARIVTEQLDPSTKPSADAGADFTDEQTKHA